MPPKLQPGRRCGKGLRPFEPVPSLHRPSLCPPQMPEYTPTDQEVGIVPWLLDGKAGVQPGARLGALLIMMTAQRRETVMSARCEDFVADEEAGGGYWHVPPLSTKHKRQPGEIGHVVPLPPPTWAVVKTALSLASGATPWLFPQVRLRRKGDKGDGHLSASAPGRAMLACGVAWSPHDIRRKFPAVVESEELGFTRIEVKAILDHAEGNSGDVTARHYALHAQLRLKRPVMTAWVDWVVKIIEANRPETALKSMPWG
jgi:integrase